MNIIIVPDIVGPTERLCWRQAPTMERCDRRYGHSGLHTWSMTRLIVTEESLRDVWIAAARELGEYVANDPDLPLEKLTRLPQTAVLLDATRKLSRAHEERKTEPKFDLATAIVAQVVAMRGDNAPLAIEKAVEKLLDAYLS